MAAISMSRTHISNIRHAGELFRAVDAGALARIEDHSCCCIAISDRSPRKCQQMIDAVAGPFATTMEAAARVAALFPWTARSYNGQDLRATANGSKGGSANSAEKAQAARENGCKGGRPRKDCKCGIVRN